MATVRQAMSLQDQVSPVLNKIIGAMGSTMRVMQQMNTAAGRGINASAFREAERSIEAAERALQEFNQEQNNVPPAQEKVRKGFSAWQAAIVTANQALQLIQTGIRKIGQLTGMADEMTTTAARVNLINDGLQTNAQLQQQIYDSAQRSRASYQGTADAVAKLNLLAADAFPTNEQAIAFSETMQKAFTVSGAGASEQAAAMTQMTQALASGRLQGDEFVSIRENAPMIAQAIAKTMGVSMGELRELSSEGAITADIIKKAVFGAAGDIEQKFQEMPMTFGAAMQAIKNTAQMQFQPVVQLFSDFVNSKQFQIWSEAVQNAIMWVVNGIIWLIAWWDALSQSPGFEQMKTSFLNVVGAIWQGLQFIGQLILNIVSFVVNNWGVIEPILIGVAILIGGIVTAMLIYNVVQGISAFLTLASATASAVKTGATIAETSATAAATAAQWGLNAAMLASPVTWIILAIIVLIAIIIAVILYIKKLWDTNIDFRVGVIRIWNSILNFFDQVPIFFMRVGYGIADAFGWAKVQVLTILQSMVNGAIDIINGLIGLLNKIPGVSIEAVEHVTFGTEASLAEDAAKQARANNLSAAEADAAAKAAQREADLQADAVQWRADAAKAAEEDAKKQADLQKKADMVTSPFDYDKLATESTGGAVPTVSKGGKLDEVGIKDEDLKYLRDIAQVEYVNRYTTSRPTIQVQFGDVHETADVNQVLEVLEDVVAGVYDSSLDRG